MQRKLISGPILLILDTHHGQIGGTEQNTLRFAQTLRQRGYNPIVVEVGQAILAKTIDSSGLNLINIPINGFSDISLQTWKKLLQEHKPSAVVRSKTWVGCLNSKLDAAMLTSGITYLSWEHHPSLAEQAIKLEASRNPLHPKALKLRIKRALRLQLHMRGAKRTVAVSNAVRNPLIEFYPAPAHKVDLIYPGVDFTFFKHNDSARKQLRKEWGVPETAFVIGSLGRLAPHKGNDFTLKIMAEMLRQNPDVDIWCVIAGKGPDLSRLEGIAKTLGINERVKFAGWQENAANAWSAIDVFLMPSSDEGLGMTLIEAAASGCIPIAARVGGMQEILCGQLDKYLCSPNDIDEWVKITSSLISPSERLKQQQIIYQEVRKRFDANTQWNLMVDWLENHA